MENQNFDLDIFLSGTSIARNFMCLDWRKKISYKNKTVLFHTSEHEKP